jgi:hypothetical protein
MEGERERGEIGGDINRERERDGVEERVKER